MAPMILLPPEALVYIFLRMTPLGVIRCRQVCHLFQALIDNSAELQYLLKLDCLGYVPPTNPRKDITYHEKVEALEEHRKGWCGRWRRTTSYSLRRVSGYTSTYDFYGGIYARGSTVSTSGDSTRCLDLHRLPSRNKNLEYKHWTHHDLGVDTRDFCMEPDLDLLVLIEMNDQVPIRDVQQGDPDATQYFTIHLRSLESSKPHPDAARPTIGYSLATMRRSTRSFYFQVVGRYLAVLFLMGAEQGTENGTCQLKIWDWTTGKAITHVNITNSETRSFSFLSDRYIVIPHHLGSIGGRRPKTLGRLNIYAFDEPAGDAPATAARHIASFQLPDLPDNLMFMPRLSCRVDPAPSPSARSATHHPGYPRVFSLAPSNRMLCLKTELTSFDISVGEFMQSEGALYIPFGSILDRLDDLPERVEQPTEISAAQLPDEQFDLLIDLLVDQDDQPVDPVADQASDQTADYSSDHISDHSSEILDGLLVDHFEQPEGQPAEKSIDQPQQPIDPSVHIPWAEWGHTSTWLDTSGLSAHNECFVFGQRVVTTGLGNDDAPTTVVFDFDPIRMRHGIASEENKSEMVPFDPETDTILDNLYDADDLLRTMFLGGECKANEFPTMRTDRIRGATELHSVMISDEHVVVVKNDRLGQESKLLVYSF